MPVSVDPAQAEQLRLIWSTFNTRAFVLFLAFGFSVLITRLKKNSAARLIEGVYGNSPWARLELPKKFISFRSKRRVLSEAERMRREGK